MIVQAFRGATRIGVASLAVLLALAVSWPAAAANEAANEAGGAVDTLSGQSLEVEVDRARIVRLDGEAGTVVIGNPMIADATLRGGDTLILTGRSYGATNLIILDPQGSEIVNRVIEVARPRDRLVTVHRGTQRSSYNCTPHCERTLMLGDAPENFNTFNGQISTRNSLSGRN